MVRRDKYEEQTLVSYFVPMKGDDQSELISSTEDEDEEETPYNFKYRKLVKKIKEYLKTKLPSYSVPSGKF